MKNKRGLGDILSPEVLTMVLAVFGIALLLVLGIGLFGIFSEKQKTEQAKASLAEMGEIVDMVSIENAKSFLMFNPSDWFLLSFEEGNPVYGCNYKTCICLCEKGDCKGNYACQETKRFVLLRDSSGTENRMLSEKLPAEFSIKLEGEDVYAYNADVAVKKTVDWDLWVTRVYWYSLTTTLFYKFDGEWKWSPDLKNWMSTDILEVSGGNFNGQAPADKNQEFIKELNAIKKDKSAGKTLFDEKGAVSSSTVIAEVKK